MAKSPAPLPITAPVRQRLYILLPMQDRTSRAVDEQAHSCQQLAFAALKVLIAELGEFWWFYDRPNEFREKGLDASGQGLRTGQYIH
jgi:hypothetical protein